MTTYSLDWCLKHNVMRLAGVECYRCAAERTQAHRLDAIVETLHIHSGRMDQNFDVLMVIEARLADQAEEIARLKEWVKHLNFKVHVLDPDTDGL
jgi:hypothetical protein